MNTDQNITSGDATRSGKPAPKRWGYIAGALIGAIILVVIGYVAVTAMQRQRELANESTGDYTKQIEVERRSDGNRTSRGEGESDGASSYVERFLASYPRDAETHPLQPLLALTEQTLATMRRDVRDYTATMVKQERVNGTLLEQQVLTCKIRQMQHAESGEPARPFSVYLRFLEPNSVKGREVIWVPDQNDGKMLAHEGGWKNLTTVRLPPKSKLAMIGNRYPITEIGLENLLVKLLEIGGTELAHGTCEVRVTHDLAINDRPCSLIEIRQTERREGQQFYRAEIYLDHELELPVRYAAYDWPEEEGGEPLLLEQYTYADLKLNVGLSDEDFDPQNSAYHFH